MPRMSLLILILLSSSLSAAEWPQYRGVNRDGASAETGLARSWPEGGPRVLWRRPIGEGYSTVSVAGGRLYTMDSDGETEYALALKPETGEVVWRTPVGPKFLDELGNGPRATPTIDGDVVYTLGGHGRLVALKAADGAKVWEVDLPQAFGAKVPTWGYSASPLVEGDLVVLEVGGAGKGLVAFDKKTGAVRWSARDGDAAYSSAAAMTIGGVRQIVFPRRVGPEVVALTPGGEVLWTHAGPPSVITMARFVPPDKVYVSAGDDFGAILLRIKSEGGKMAAEEVWKTRQMKNHFNDPVAVGDHLYGFDNATFKCLSLATGEQAWAQRGLGKGSLIAADGLLIVLSDRGTLVLAEPSPAGYKELARFDATQGKAWTSPTLADGRLYLRDEDEIVALDLRKPS